MTDPDSDDLQQVYDLHKRSFRNAELRDTLEDFQRWLTEDQQPGFEAAYQLADLLVALKQGDAVCGYLYAQHYLKRRLIIISYICVEPQNKEAMHLGLGVRTMLRKLLELCDRPLVPWEAIIGEIEFSRADDPLHGTEMFGRFRSHVASVSREIGGTGSALFRIDFDYVQPPLSPHYLGRRPIERSRHQYLMYVSRDMSLLRRDNRGDYWLSEQQAVNVFQTLLLEWYADSYDESLEYQKAMQDIFDGWRPRLRGGLRLIPASRTRKVGRQTSAS